MLLQFAPYFGYLASVCLIIALIVNNDLKFRWFNSFGNVCFITYAILLNTIPVLITNAILLGINVYYLVKIYGRKENFDLLEFTATEKLPLKFLDFHQADIANYFPNFTIGELAGKLNFTVTRDLVIANIFSATITDQGDAIVALNYTVPKFRDFKVGTFIFEKEKNFLLSKKVKRIVYQSVENPGHLEFLKVNGFTTQQIGNTNCYVKEL
ncbi:MAG: hypothetical protein EOO06_01460 [Chitinophagaceae bacterium]|nr:MAG: hypothetical protein EOO06_01460 [Chitinophagaceae bacterium]